MSAIRGFRGEYWFLSNFFWEPDNTHVEGEFQRAKCLYASDRKKFHNGIDERAPFLDPSTCKKMGHFVTLRPDWSEIDPKTGNLVKVEIMSFYVHKKFADHESLAWRLIATEDRYIEETNTWHDVFWGVCTGCFKNNKPWNHGRMGMNVLGAILMQVREGL